MNQQKIPKFPNLQIRAEVAPSSIDMVERTVELVWSTGSQVRRFDFWTEKEWIEELSLNPEHVRLDRLNKGAPLLANHSSYSLNDVLGVVEEARIENSEGKARVRFGKSDQATAIFNEVRDGILKNISVGYRVHKFEEQKEKQDDLKVFRAVDWEPMELSIVAIPADHEAQIRSAENFHSVLLMTREVKEMAKTVENSPETRGAESTVSENKAVDIDQVRSESTKAERDRQRSIRAFGDKFNERVEKSFIDKCVDDGLSFEESRAAILEVVSKKIDSETSRSDSSVTVDEKDKFIEAGVNAILARAGKAQADGANEFRGMRLTELAKACLNRSGVSYKGLSELEMVKRAFNMDRAVAQSTSDFPILLESAMHKTLQNAYQKASDTWRRFCAVGSVTDFRAHNRYRLGSFGNLDTLTESSEFKNKTIPDGEKESITASTRGNLISISRAAIINDDLGAFIGLSAMLARAAARTIEADVYALLASNPIMSDGVALFHATHGNLAAVGSAVSVASIEAGRVAMASQPDVSGNDFIESIPAAWVGGMSTGGTAREVFAAEYNDEATKNQKKPNIIRGLVSDIIDTPRISGLEWYLFADPADAPALEVAFLNGDDTPFLDSTEGFNVDGMQWKVRLDYGVAAVDYRPAYKNPGA